MKRKNVRMVLKKRANEFTEKLADFIKRTDWELGIESITINPKKLEKTKIKLEFEIREDALETIKNEVISQSSIEEFSAGLEEEVEVKE